MPNHVVSKVTMKNIGKRKEYYSNLDTDNPYFDFNKIIEQPEELSIEDGSTTMWGIYAYLTACYKGVNRYLNPLANHAADSTKLMINPNCLPSNEDLEKAANRLHKSLNELEEIGKTAIENARKYGAVTWYNWRCENWGCKWNSYDLSIKDDDTIFITTPWSPPEGIFIKLSKDNPYDPIYVQYANEDPSIGGYLEYLDGELVQDDPYEYSTEESVLNYEELWGVNYLEDYEDEDEECVPAFSYNLIECEGEKDNGQN